MFSPRLDAAFALAHDLHYAQIRKTSGIPYIGHLLLVTGTVIEGGGDEDETIAAVFHDGPEDQGCMELLEKIRKRFGDRVADIVAGCSDTFVTPKPPWKERKEAYISHLPTASKSVLLVSAADKLCNARATFEDYLEVGDKVFERFRGGKEGTLWYYRALIDVYKSCEITTGTKKIVRALDSTWNAMEMFVRMADIPVGESHG